MKFVVAVTDTLHQINSSRPSFSIGMTRIEQVVDPANKIETVSQTVADLNEHALGSFYVLFFYLCIACL